MIKLIIFDLDGVLVDTEHFHYESLIDAIEFVTGYPGSTYSHLIKVDGTTTKHKLLLLKNYLRLSDLQIQLIDDKKQQYLIRHLFRGLNSSPTQLSTLTTLSKNYKLAVASNSRKENVLTILNILGITDLFTIILSSNDVSKSKPDPEMFISSMNIAGAFPVETLILEDSDAGKYAAVASGAHVLPVDSISDVTLENIQNEIQKINSYDCCANGGPG